MKSVDLSYLYNLERFGIKMGLEVMEKLLAITDRPDKKWPSVHVIGTNGKGSTANFLASALQASGLKVGLYTSPHLYSFNERIRVNGQEISNERLQELTKKLKTLVEKHNLSPTFFEFTTALAFMEFAEQKVDIAVIEVGLGGPLDATNVITPLITIITNIGLDHVDILGKTTTAIAKQEAEVIKKDVPVVTAEKDPAILKLFQDKCLAQNTTLHTVENNLEMTPLTANFKEQSFSVKGAYEGKLTIPLLGDHQIVNAGSALLALHLLKEKGFNIPWQTIKKGLADTKHEGRLDIISTSPLIIVDGAHNADGVHALAKWLKAIPRYDVLIIASKKDNDLRPLMKNIVPLFSHIIVTQGSYMPEDTSLIAEKVKKLNKPVQEIPDIKEAIEAGNKLLNKKSTMLITGSLYMVGDALSVLKKHP